jgi:hypothetical protein
VFSALLEPEALACGGPIRRLLLPVSGSVLSLFGARQEAVTRPFYLLLPILGLGLEPSSLSSSPASAQARPSTEIAPQVLGAVTISPFTVEPLDKPLPTWAKALNAQEQGERAASVSQAIAGHIQHKKWQQHLSRHGAVPGSTVSGLVRMPLSLPMGQSHVYELRGVERLVIVQLALCQPNREPVTVEAALPGRMVFWSHQRRLRLSFARGQKWVLGQLAEQAVDRALDRLSDELRHGVRRH